MASDENFLQKNAKEILSAMQSGFTLSGMNSAPTELKQKQEPKVEEKKMKTAKKVHKIGKGKPVEKLLSRLSGLQTFNRLGLKVDRWLNEEPSNDNKTALANLKEILTKLENERAQAVQLAANLQSIGYKPPKRQGVAGLKFETNKHIWIKPKFAEPFKIAYGAEAMQTLFIDSVVDGRVLVSLGDPSGNLPTFKFLVPKQQVQMTQPE